MTPQYCIAIIAAILKTTQTGNALETSNKTAVNHAIELWHLVTTEVDDNGDPL